MNIEFDKINVEGFLEPDEIHAMDNFNKEDLFNYVFKRIIFHNEIWRITNGKIDLLIPSFDKIHFSCPVFPSNGIAKAFRQAALSSPSNNHVAHYAADLYPRVYSIREFTDDVIKTLDNNKKSEIKLILYTYDNARELSTKEFLNKIEQYK